MLCRFDGATAAHPKLRGHQRAAFIQASVGAASGEHPHAIIAPVTDSSSPGRGSPPLLSFRDAATITGLPRREIRARVRRGEIAVRVRGKGQSAKLRLTLRALAEAGLLDLDPPAADPVSTDTPARLLDMIHDQGVRIAALEDQRFQLAGQLGAAIERSRALEQQLRVLAAPPAAAVIEPVRATARTSSTHQSGTSQRSPRAPSASSTVRDRDTSLRDDTRPGSETDTIVATAMRDATPTAGTEVHGPQEPSRAWRAGTLMRRGASRLLRRPSRGNRSSR